MSEGSGAAHHASHSLTRHQSDVVAGIVFIVLAVLGPVLGLIFGKSSGPDGSTIADAVRAGWYSFPLAIFGIIALSVRIRSPQDYYGGAVLAAMALFAVWACNDLPGMRGFAFGPGTAPRMFAYCLLALGVAVALVGLVTDGPPAGEYSFSGPLGGAVLIVALIPITYYSNKIGRWVPGVAPDVAVAALGGIVVLALAILLMRIVPRGPLFITAATLVFAVTVRPLGLVIASFVSLVVSAYATHEIRWVETIIWAAVLTLFCALLFPYGLNLPLQLWPRF
jgi:putative tricarboxylic transport membrane protein